MTWIVAANTNDCRIYHLNEKEKTLTLIKEINHPENKKKASEYLTSDKPGHYHAGAAHGAYEPHTDPKEVQINDFARLIAHALNKGRNDNAFSKLMIIALPHMSGLLAKHLDKHVSELITKTIHKEVLQMSEKELMAFLQEHQR